MKLNRRVIETATKIICRFKANRKMLPPPVAEAVKVNLGCGLAVANGWLNIDGSLNALVASWPAISHPIIYNITGAKSYYSCEDYCLLLRSHRFIHHDLSYGIPFQDNTVDFVYSSHFLEHLPRRDGQKLLLEAYRVLKKGGKIRICVPDLLYAISLYNNGEKEKMLENYFFIDDQESHFARHKYMYDFELLQSSLSQAGFVKVRRFFYREGSVPDLDILDNRPDDTLYVEGEKQ